MKRLERILDRLTPNRWPVRWRLAAVSATLTLVILVVFALVVGRLTSNRIQGDFNNELRDTASRLAIELPTGHVDGQAMSLSGTDAIRVVTSNGAVYRTAHGTTYETPAAPKLGPPNTRQLVTVGSLRVATQPIQTGQIPPLFLQFARSTESLEATIHRLWLFLGIGVLGGTVLAALAGIAVAGRAMRPIADLTVTAREIATTRDPSRRMPEP
jgi:hypothetical protein